MEIGHRDEVHPACRFAFLPRKGFQVLDDPRHASRKIGDLREVPTDLPGVFACGECAVTGVHGANRLGGNSLLEGAYFGEQGWALYLGYRTVDEAAIGRALDSPPAPASVYPFKTSEA